MCCQQASWWVIQRGHGAIDRYVGEPHEVPRCPVCRPQAAQWFEALRSIDADEAARAAVHHAPDAVLVELDRAQEREELGVSELARLREEVASLRSQLARADEVQRRQVATMRGIFDADVRELQQHEYERERAARELDEPGAPTD
jgi:hypothetical protein